MHPENHDYLGIKDVYNLLVKRDFTLVKSFNSLEAMLGYITMNTTYDQWKSLVVVKLQYPQMGINTLGEVKARMFNIEQQKPNPGLFEIIKEN